MTNSTNKPNTGFWIIGIIALIWNLMGVMAYIAQAFMTDEMLAALPENEQALYVDVPSWVTAAFAIAVFAGALGCILLLIRKKMASMVFIISLIAILIQMTYNIILSDASDVYGASGMIMPIMVIVIGFFLVWYSNDVAKKGWLF